MIGANAMGSYDRYTAPLAGSTSFIHGHFSNPGADRFFRFLSFPGRMQFEKCRPLHFKHCSMRMLEKRAFDARMKFGNTSCTEHVSSFSFSSGQVYLALLAAPILPTNWNMQWPRPSRYSMA